MAPALSFGAANLNSNCSVARATLPIRGRALPAQGQLERVVGRSHRGSRKHPGRATGTTVLVTNVTGASRVEALAFGPGDVLYAMGSVGADGNSENLYTLNAATGQLTLIGPTGFADVDTLTFGPDGFLYGANARAAVTNELLRISPLTGVGTVVGNTGVFGLNGIAVVPEPSTILLAFAGLGCWCASVMVRRGRMSLAN